MDLPAFSLLVESKRIIGRNYIVSCKYMMTNVDFPDLLKTMNNTGVTTVYSVTTVDNARLCSSKYACRRNLDSIFGPSIIYSRF